MEEFLMIRDLYNQGLNISQIAQTTGFDRKTVRKSLATQTPPLAKPRTSKPGKLDAYKGYIQNRITDYPLSAARIYREIQEQGFNGKYTIVKDYIRDIRPPC
jgi:transposase